MTNIRRFQLSPRLYFLLAICFACGSCITGGQHVTEREAYPFLVAVYANRSFQCGGSIIGPFLILTAAHCLCTNEKLPNGVTVTRSLSADELSILPGELNIADISANQLHTVTKVYINNRAISCVQYHNGIPEDDVAILQLATAVSPSITQQPAVLFDGPPKSTIVELVGWDTLKVYVAGNPDWPQFVQTETVPWKDCRYLIHKYHFNRDTDKTDLDALHRYDSKQICTRGQINNKPTDACRGDSGGPVIMRTSSGEVFLAGIISSSFNATCGHAENPGVHVNITFYRDWIRQVISQFEASLATETQSMVNNFTQSIEAFPTVLYDNHDVGVNSTDQELATTDTVTINETIHDTNTTFMKHWDTIQMYWKSQWFEIAYVPASLFILAACFRFWPKISAELFSEYEKRQRTSQKLLALLFGWVCIKTGVVLAAFGTAFAWDIEKSQVSAMFSGILLEIAYLLLRYHKSRRLVPQREGLNGPAQISGEETVDDLAIKPTLPLWLVKELRKLNLDSSVMETLGSVATITMGRAQGFPVQKTSLLEKYPIQKPNIRPVSISTVYKYSKQLLHGLQYLHHNKIVHGALDIRSVLVQGEDQIIISGLMNHPQRANEGSRYVGTNIREAILWYAFMSPEAIMELDDPTIGLTAATDIWSFACVLVYLLTESFTEKIYKSKIKNVDYLVNFISTDADGKPTRLQAGRPGKLIDEVKKQKVQKGSVRLSYGGNDDQPTEDLNASSWKIKISDENVQALLHECFRMKPSNRPPVDKVLKLLHQALGEAAEVRICKNPRTQRGQRITNVEEETV